MLASSDSQPEHAASWDWIFLFPPISDPSALLFPFSPFLSSCSWPKTTIVCHSKWRLCVRAVCLCVCVCVFHPLPFLVVSFVWIGVMPLIPTSQEKPNPLFPPHRFPSAVFRSFRPTCPHQSLSASTTNSYFEIHSPLFSIYTAKKVSCFSNSKSSVFFKSNRKCKYSRIGGSYFLVFLMRCLFFILPPDIYT